MTLDPKLFGENPARDQRFESKDRWHELPNYPHDDPRSSLEFLTRQMNEEINATEMAARGDNAGAADEFRDMLPVLQRRLGRYHPDTLAAAEWIDYLLGKDGQTAP